MVKLVGVGLLALQVGRVETVPHQSWLSRPASVSEWVVSKPWWVYSGFLWSGLLFGFWVVSTRPFA